jgi:hypothetical protein
MHSEEKTISYICDRHSAVRVYRLNDSYYVQIFLYNNGEVVVRAKQKFHTLEGATALANEINNHGRLRTNSDMDVQDFFEDKDEERTTETSH